MESHPFPACSYQMDFILIDTQDFLDKGYDLPHVCAGFGEKTPVQTLSSLSSLAFSSKLEKLPEPHLSHLYNWTIMGPLGNYHFILNCIHLS